VAGWSVAWDEGQRKPFYWNQVTGVTTWELRTNECD
jgi:hypothetical protein